MIILILGLALWCGAHLLKRLAPRWRAQLGGNAAEGQPPAPIALALLAGTVLMILGFRMSGFFPIWTPPVFLTHLNNLLMVFALYLVVASMMPVAVSARMRHPQLTGFKLWAFAHLMVNGDLASILLFGGLLGWAVLEMILINRAETWSRPHHAIAWPREAAAVGITLILLVAIGYAHTWLGYYPYGG